MKHKSLNLLFVVGAFLMLGTFELALSVADIQNNTKFHLWKLVFGLVACAISWGLFELYVRNPMEFD